MSPVATPNLVTVAGVTGPGDTLASKQYVDVTNINIDLIRQVLTLTRSGGLTPIEVDLYGIATVTYTIAAHIATISFT